MIIHRLHNKTNFVDANNVLVGWDTSQHCCEDAAWALHADESAAMLEGSDVDIALLPYSFDPDSTQERAITSVKEHCSYDNSVRFRLVAPGLPDLFLVLSNHHNGYYSHGFNVDVGGKTVWDSQL